MSDSDTATWARGRPVSPRPPSSRPGHPSPPRSIRRSSIRSGRSGRRAVTVSSNPSANRRKRAAASRRMVPCSLATAGGGGSARCAPGCREGARAFPPLSPLWMAESTAYNRENPPVKRERGSMADEEMEIYPIEHKGKVYNIITAFDMTFREVRGMLDWLSKRNAFHSTPEDKFIGPGKMFTCEVEGILLEVDGRGWKVGRCRRVPARRWRRGGSLPLRSFWIISTGHT